MKYADISLDKKENKIPWPPGIFKRIKELAINKSRTPQEDFELNQLMNQMEKWIQRIIFKGPKLKSYNTFVITPIGNLYPLYKWQKQDIEISRFKDLDRQKRVVGYYDSDDLMQDCRFRLLKIIKRHKFETGGINCQWIEADLQRMIIEKSKVLKNKKKHEKIIVRESIEEDPMEERKVKILTNQSILLRLKKVLKDLGPSYQQLAQLCLFSDKNQKEICQEMKISDYVYNKMMNQIGEAMEEK